ncbi:KpsF/GutQ family sugar-phosphate isomerase [Sphingomonas sp. CFBP 8760]|uniref:KpsF/GutQ family sugar-phosphate isomerase n=1 Tax=Sphingomonas sp. CFBP 8760 TaxID=2775282 RepID=UPI001FCF0D55|nr:KpsF/GutQ family sugar-phosphate isomerase [Sphingomonas sp. CFBP 8760]
MIALVARQPRSFAARAARDWFADVIAGERQALEMFERSIPDSVTAVVAAIAAQRRPIACLGVGKSGLVAAKVAATFSSLGTPAFFLNAAEAAHGDLGAVQDGSLVLLFSNSGTTDEIIRILPILRARNCTLIGVVGRADCPLARAVSHLIPATIGGEADHIGMAPTASTTLQMAIGDGLAVAVSRARAFTREDFLRHHPAGLLGRQMVPIHAVMRTGMELPVALPSASVAELLAVMSGGRMGAACIVDHERRLVGLVVDGDIRRHLQARHDVYTTPAHALMQSEPQVIGLDARLGEAMVMMREHAGGLLVLPVTDADGRLHGMLHVNDILNG